MDAYLGDVLRLRFGRVVTLHCPDFMEKLACLDKAETDVLIDLDDVVSMDSAAMGALMRLRTSREKRGQRCYFTAQLPGLMRILNAANVQLALTPGRAACDL